MKLLTQLGPDRLHQLGTQPLTITLCLKSQLPFNPHYCVPLKPINIFVKEETIRRLKQMYYLTRNEEKTESICLTNKNSLKMMAHFKFPM